MIAIGIVIAVAPAEAYIGPGAGFALISSLFVLVTTLLLAFLVLYPAEPPINPEMPIAAIESPIRSER